MSPVILFKEGGPVVYLVLVVLVSAPVPIVAAFVASLLRIRVPGFVWLTAALVPLLLGFAGTFQGLNLANMAIANASIEMKGMLAANGLSVALYCTVFAAAGSALVVPAGALAIGAGALVGKGTSDWRPGALVLGGLFLLGAVGLAATGSFIGAFAVGLTAVSWMAVATRLPEEKDLRGVVLNHHFTVAALGGTAILSAMVHHGGTAAVLALQARANASGPTRDRLIAAALDGLVPQLALLGCLGVSIVLAGVAAVLLHRRDVRKLALVVDIAGAGVLAACVALSLGLVGWTGTGLYMLSKPFSEERAPVVQASGIQLPSVDAGSRRLYPTRTLHFGSDGPQLDGSPLDRVGPGLERALIEADQSLALSSLTVFEQRLDDEPLALAVLRNGAMEQIAFRARSRGNDATRGLIVEADRVRRIQNSGRWNVQETADALDALDLPRGDRMEVWIVDGTVGDLAEVLSTLAASRIDVTWRMDGVPELYSSRGVGERVEGLADASDLELVGSLDRQQVQGVVKRHMNQLRYCYERALAKDPTLSGRVDVKFVVAADGTVASATTTENTVGPTVGSCVEGRFKRMRFPEPSGGGIVIVEYPLVFEAP